MGRSMSAANDEEWSRAAGQLSKPLPDWQLTSTAQRLATQERRCRVDFSRAALERTYMESGHKNWQ